MLQMKQTRRQQPAQRPTQQGIQLDQLAVRMDECGNNSMVIKDKLGYKSLKKLIAILGVICCTNMYSMISHHSFWLAETASSKDLYFRSEPPELLKSLGGMNERIFGRKRGLTIFMSGLMLAVCLACELGLGTSTYFQYKYDYYKFNLNYFNTSILFTGPNRTGQSDLTAGLTYERALALEQELQSNEQEARVPLANVGSFLMQHPYFSEGVYLYMILLCATIYLAPILHYSFKGSFDSPFCRLLLNWDQEQLNCNRLIEYSVKEFASSSENFLMIVRDQRMLCNVGYCFKSEPTALVKHYEARQREQVRTSTLLESNFINLIDGSLERNLSSSPRSETRSSDGKRWRDIEGDVTKQRTYFDEHRWTIERLKQFALSGQLQPLDRSDVNQLDQRMLQYSALGTLALSSCLIWDTCFWAYLLPIKFGFNYQLDLKDQLTLLEALILNALLTLGATHFAGLVLMDCRENAESMRELRARIIRFVNVQQQILNDCIPNHLIAMVGTKSDASSNEQYELINSDLLLILMHYRIFVAQLRPARKPLGFVLLCCLGVMIIFPIICRLHVPYIADRDSRITGVIISGIMICATDLAFVPICWMNSGCLALNKSLWCLMATLVAIAEHPKYGFLLSEHSVWLIRKELSHPERIKNQSAIAALGIEFTYTKLLKLHFWLGLLVLLFVYDLASGSDLLSSPILAYQELKKRQSVFGSLFSDPLGIISKFMDQVRELIAS